MSWHKDAITPGELDALYQAACRAWGADTRYPLASSGGSSGQCYVTARWLVERLGGYVGRRQGHYAWVSPDGRYVIDLTGNHTGKATYVDNPGFTPDSESTHIRPERAARFIKRANRIFDSLDLLLRYSLDYAGDAYPAEETQRSTDLQYWHDEPTFQLPTAQYKFVYANGNLEVSPDHDHSELTDHAGVSGDHTGPMAVGWIVVTNGKATWETKSNVNIGALERIFKDYGKNVGWDWGGITNVEGEPINDRFAPKKGQTIRYAFANDHLYLGRISHSELLLQAAEDGDQEAQTPLVGYIGMDAKRAVVWPVHVAAIPALCEWAEDRGLELFAATVDGLELGQPKCRNCGSTDLSPSIYHRQTLYQCRACNSYTQIHGEGLRVDPDVKVPVYSLPELGPVHQGASDNLLHRVEDLELENTGDNAGDFEKNKGDIRDPGEYREPSGLYRCPSCQRLFPNWKLYQKHRRELESEGDQFDDGKFPEINMDPVSPFEPHFTPQQPEIIPISSYREASRVDGFQGGFTTDDYYVCYHYGSPVGYARVSGAKLRDLVCIDEQYREPILAKVVKYTEQSPSQLLPAPMPFIYDIQEDTVTVGQAGQRTSDIPGQFTPGGIIEGQYEPGGKVIVRSMTNMPYSVRHMVELWYWQHPELEVKNVHLQDAAGGDTKLAAGEDVGGTIAKLLASSPASFAAAQTLREVGGNVFAVGGAVRDALAGKTPKDIDLMVTGVPANAVQAALEQLPGRVDYTGKDFGVFRYRNKGDEVEVALPRRERSTGPQHRDFEVQGDHTMTPEEDLYRRDFTANAMAVDLSNGRLIDPYGGADDLAAGRLRTINPQSLNEDPLRVVRALVAHARHGLVPDEKTRQQMADNADSLTYEPAERIQQELDKLFAADRPGDAIRLARETGVLQHILPEVDRAFGYDQNNPHHELELGNHLVNVLDRTAEKSNDPDLRLAALMHDVGKPDSAWVDPETGSNHYYMKKMPDGTTLGQQHEDVGAELTRNRMANLRYPNDRIKRVEGLIRNHMWRAFTSERGARKFLNRVGDHADDLMTLRWADQGGKTEYPTDPTLSLDAQRNLVERVRNSQQATNQSQLAVNGNDLLQAGVPQGPQIGQILRQLTEAVIEDPRMNTRERLLTLALQNGTLQHP